MKIIRLLTIFSIVILCSCGSSTLSMEDELTNGSNFSDSPQTFSVLSNATSLETNNSSISTAVTSEIISTNKCDEAFIPTLSNDKKFVTFGLYPQTRILDNSLVNKLDSIYDREANGWYLFEGEFYARRVKLFHKKGFFFFNDQSPTSSQPYYWFKCEPIEWIVLERNQDEYLLLSSFLLEVDRFNKGRMYNYDSLYSSSDIRKWLNNEFYVSAFFNNDQYFIEEEIQCFSALDNNDNITIKDKVFLLSFEDYQNASYGFKKLETLDANRIGYITDWSILNTSDNGLLYLNSDYIGGCVYNNKPVQTYGYWSRPSKNNRVIVLDELGDGNFDLSPYTFSEIDVSFGIRPAIRIRF